ncbi:hypothetical protein ABT144_04670 [Streptomyces sp. NPDC002039]|uniref:hypothetical protein n=1 Tax=Streptomyces sp. NPDC002039 TaxID=3154660 RepID=UPI00331CC903
MLIILGLIVLIAAVVVAVAGVLGNAGVGHGIGQGFDVFGYHVTGSTGTLFLYGMVLGAVVLFGLLLLLAGARRAFRQGRTARAELGESRRHEAAARAERDQLISAREAAAADTGAAPARDPANGVAPTPAPTDQAPTGQTSTDQASTTAATNQAPPTDESRPAGGVPRRRHLFGH